MPEKFEKHYRSHQNPLGTNECRYCNTSQYTKIIRQQWQYCKLEEFS